jgi:hypothetical protein
MVRCLHLDRAFVVAALVAVLLPSYSESSPTTFERTYGGTGDDICQSVQQTADGGYIAAGVSDLSDSAAVFLVKTDASGDTLWTREFGGARHAAEGRCVRQTTDSCFIVAGNTDITGPGATWLIKTNAIGETLWTRTYGGVALMVEQTTDVGYVIVGSTSYRGTDLHLIKTDSIGDTLWTKTYGGAANDKGKTVQQTRDGGYIIAGQTRSFGSGGQDAWIIKTDSVGETLWTRSFGGDSTESGISALRTNDGRYLVAGWTWSYSDSPQLYLVKTDAGGDALWTKTIGIPGCWLEANSVEQVKDGGYVLVGSRQDVTVGGFPGVLLVRTDANGDTLWTRSFGGEDLSAGYSVHQTTDDGYIIAGQTYASGAGASDFYLIKTDENGNLAVAEPKSGPSRKSALSLACEPNPFRSSTVLHLTTGPLDHAATHLRIYDAQGRLVRTLAASQATQTVWDGRNDAGQLLPSGTYLVRCDAAGTHATTRLVLQR